MRLNAVPIKDNITSGLKKLEQMPLRVFDRAMDWAEKDLQQQFAAEKWTDWPTETFRVNGEVIPARRARDIIDTGALMQSQRRSDMGNNTTEFVWTGDDRDYASFVHDGYISIGGRKMPGRPWTEATIDDIDAVVNDFLRQEIRRNG